MESGPFFLRAGRTAADDRLDATIRSDELAYRMRQTAVSVIDVTNAGEHTKTMFGTGEKATDEFGCTPFSQNRDMVVTTISTFFRCGLLEPTLSKGSRLERPMSLVTIRSKRRCICTI